MNFKTLQAILPKLLAAMLVISVGAVTISPVLAKKIMAPPPEHYRVEMDPKATEMGLLPIPPNAVLPSEKLLAPDLAHVPEVQLHKPVLVPVPKNEAALSEKEQIELSKARERAIVHTARLTTHINYLNKKKPDRFVELLVEHRLDLAGLPFVMGSACRLSTGDRKQFKIAVDVVSILHDNMASMKSPSDFWKSYDSNRKSSQLNLKVVEDRICAAACMQMLALESAELLVGLVKRLEAFNRSDLDKKAAAHALTNLAVFSQEKEVRQAAIAALQNHPETADKALLLHGLHYPWPSIAQNSADAVTQLKRQDLIPDLISMLDSPDPRAPIVKEVKNQKVSLVREVVRINHHRNCLLCHPPGNTPDVMTTEVWQGVKPRAIEKGVEAVDCNIRMKADDVLTGTVPSAGEALPTGSRGYRRFSSPDIIVRADVTYLRQDFSLLQKVPSAHPWPEMQRFDYLMRSRVVTEDQAQTYRAEIANSGDSPYHQAALGALRLLTGKNAGTTAKEWRDALGIK
jgi:hypothetical protein